jgi:hypothetical protein
MFFYIQERRKSFFKNTREDSFFKITKEIVFLKDKRAIRCENKVTFCEK